MTQYPDQAPLPGYDPDPANRWNGRSGNIGLWYDKYCDRWQNGFGALYKPAEERRQNGQIIQEACKGGRIEWLEKMLAVSKTPRDRELLAEHAERQRQYAQARKGICFRAKTAKKFASGLGRAHPVQNGFEWHYTLGVPVLRASGQKGVVWDWVRNWASTAPDETEGKRILGTPDNVGSVDFLPALPVTPPKLCIDGTTPHLTEYYQDGEVPADWYDPKPLQWLAVDRGNEFQFAVTPARTHPPGSPLAAQSQQDVETAGKWLLDALTTIGAGAATAADRGLFERISGWHYDPASLSPI